MSDKENAEDIIEGQIAQVPQENHVENPVVIAPKVIEPDADTTDLAVQSDNQVSITQIPFGALLLDNPAQVVQKVSEMAKELVNIVDSLNLYKQIQGRKYVFVDGWEILGGMLGASPHEESSVRRPDGSYEAVVVIKRNTDGAIIGRASAICGMDEKDRNGKPTWGERDEYARKSMATTRAAGKAFRLTFSWVMKMAGYEGTPAEEMKEEYIRDDEKSNAPAPAPAPVVEKKTFSFEKVDGKLPEPVEPKDKKLFIKKYGEHLGLDKDGLNIATALKQMNKKFEDFTWDKMIAFVEKLALLYNMDPEKESSTAPVQSQEQSAEKPQE